MKWQDGRRSTNVEDRRGMSVGRGGGAIGGGGIIILLLSWTHGSSAQRVRWFRDGLESGELRRCDTFKAERL